MRGQDDWPSLWLYVHIYTTQIAASFQERVKYDVGVQVLYHQHSSSTMDDDAGTHNATTHAYAQGTAME